MMPVWQVVLLVNLALGVGMGVGYASWGRQVKSLEQDLDAARARIERLERELKARAAGAPAGEQQWEARGVVRAIFPGSDMLVITHEEIQGLMPAMTMGFRAASPDCAVGAGTSRSWRSRRARESILPPCAFSPSGSAPPRSLR
jgi:hypothetical protein